MSIQLIPSAQKHYAQMQNIAAMIIFLHLNLANNSSF